MSGWAPPCWGGRWFSGGLVVIEGRRPRRPVGVSIGDRVRVAGSASASPFPSTSRFTRGSARGTESGSAIPENPTSTSPYAQRSPPPNTGRTASYAASHPSNSPSPTKPRSKPSRPGRPPQPPSHTTGDTGSSHCRPTITTAASRPTSTPTHTPPSTRTPSNSPQQHSPSILMIQQDPLAKTLRTSERRPSQFTATSPFKIPHRRSERPRQGRLGDTGQCRCELRASA